MSYGTNETPDVSGSMSRENLELLSTNVVRELIAEGSIQIINGRVDLEASTFHLVKKGVALKLVRAAVSARPELAGRLQGNVTLQVTKEDNEVLNEAVLKALGLK